VLPKGNSLEGFLASGVYSVDLDITPDALIRKLLDKWMQVVGPTMAQARSSKQDFYKILTLASLVERETPNDAEKPKIAGVYTNRLDPSMNATGLMNAEPTVVYAVDTDDLAKLDFKQWPKFAFWTLVGQALAKVKVSPELQSFQTWQHPGLPDWPLDTPSLSSIQAALAPNLKGGYLYFYACPGAANQTFSQTLQQQQKVIAACAK
jgi:UPF0755 protein